MIKRKLIFVSFIFAMGVNGFAFADNNPYSLFNSDSANTSSVQAPAVSGTSGFSTSAPVAQIQNNLPANPPRAAATNSAPQIQYLQPANQVGKTTATSMPQAVTFAAPTVKSNGAGSMSQAQGGFNSLQDPDGTDTPPPANYPTYTDVLGQIQVNTLNTVTNTATGNQNTLATATNTSNSAAALTKLLAYWNTPPVYESTAVPPAFQAFLNANSYGQVASLNTQYTTSGKATEKYLNNFVDLSAKWPEIIAADPLPPLSENLPYADLLTGGISQGGISERYWASAVNQALFNLSVSQDSMTALQKAVLVPFGGNPDWTSQLQQATSPDLLRMIVTQQAINNALTYQLLQRENDRALMQASELRMLSELNATMVDIGEEQIRQQQRIVTAISQQKTN